MKIAFILHREYTKIGGLELLVKGLSQELSKQLPNDNIYIVSFGDIDSEEDINTNLKYITIKSKYIFNGMYPIPSILSIVKMYKTLNRVNPDKFITFGRHFITTWIAHIWGIRKNKIRLHNEQANNKHVFKYKIFNILQNIQDATIVKYILHKASIIFPGSDSVREFLKNNWKLDNLSEQNLTSFIDTEKLEKCRETKREETEKIILFAGRLVELKGFKYFLKLCRKYKENKEYRFIMIGEGEGENEVKEFIKNGEGNLEYLGKLPHEATLGYISTCDLFVLPSKVEGLPTSLLEARYYNRNILCSDIGPNREALDGYCNASYVDINEVNIYSKLDKIIKRKAEFESMNPKFTLDYQSQILIKYIK